MLSKKLKKLRTDKGYTLMQLAEKSGVSYVQIGRYENDKSAPSGKTLTKLAEALEVNMEDLLKNSFETDSISDEQLDAKYRKIKKVLRENDMNRRTLDGFFDLLLFKGNVNKMLDNEPSY
nr:helix-turn-helix transcriptional regulator [Allomuricauda sp.]